MRDTDADQHVVDWELCDAVERWERAECYDCGERFDTERDAAEHAGVFGHRVLHVFGQKAVN